MYTEKKHHLKVTKKIKKSRSPKLLVIKAVTNQVQDKPYLRHNTNSASVLLSVITCLGSFDHCAEEAHWVVPTCASGFKGICVWGFGQKMFKSHLINKFCLLDSEWHVATEFPSSLICNLVAVVHWPNDFTLSLLLLFSYCRLQG